MDTVECLVVGGGVVGWRSRGVWPGRARSDAWETSDQIGSGISSRNSEVIHAGIYYRPGSLKARLCVAGKHALYDYCRNNAVPHQRCGKPIVATDDEEASLLSGIRRTAADNGVDLTWLSCAQVQELEPQVRATAGLLSDTTGIIDSHALMRGLQRDAERGVQGWWWRSRHKVPQSPTRASLCGSANPTYCAVRWSTRQGSGPSRSPNGCRDPIPHMCRGCSWPKATTSP